MKTLLYGAVGAVVLTVAGQAILAQTAATPTQCSLTDKGRFDIGGVETVEKQQYRCVATLGADLRATGTAWIRVDAQGRPTVP